VWKRFENYIKYDQLKDPTKQSSKPKAKQEKQPEVPSEEQQKFQSLLLSAIKDLFEKNERFSSYHIDPNSFTVRVVKKPLKKEQFQYVSNIALIIAGRIQKQEKEKGFKQETNEPKQTNQKPNPVVEYANEIATALVKLMGESEYNIDKGHIVSVFKGKSQSIEPTSKQHTAQEIDKKEGIPNTTQKPAHKLEITLQKAVFTDESYQLYKNYQITVHKDKPEKITSEGYIRFLVEGFTSEKKSLGTTSICYGNYHQYYKLDGKLIAVGVVDLLPKCLSSVYFFYDTKYEFLDLGVVSALNEIKWVKEHLTSEFKYYYMGFYIHTCQKMKYKAAYKPSDLLCDKTFEWVPVERCLPKLDKTKYCKFSDKDPSPKPPVEKILAQLPIIFKKKELRLEEFTQSTRQIVRPRLMKYIELVGPDLAGKMTCELK